jgi:Ser/Thr protein kinase RdoA (MazF antagonist)
MQDFDSDNYLEIFDQHLERLRPFRPAADILQSLEQFRPFVSRLEGLSSLYSQCHNDYGPGNILVDGTTITVLDIPWGFYDSIYHDLSYFVMQLETLNFSWKQPLFNQANIRRWTDLFIHTYFHEKPVNQLLLELHLLRNLIRRADNVYAKLSHSSSLRQSLKALRFDPYFRSQINGAIKTIQMLYQTNQQG